MIRDLEKIAELLKREDVFIRRAEQLARALSMFQNGQPIEEAKNVLKQEELDWLYVSWLAHHDPSACAGTECMYLEAPISEDGPICIVPDGIDQYTDLKKLYIIDNGSELEITIDTKTGERSIKEHSFREGFYFPEEYRFLEEEGSGWETDPDPRDKAEFRSAIEYQTFENEDVGPGCLDIEHYILRQGGSYWHYVFRTYRSDGELRNWYYHRVASFDGRKRFEQYRNWLSLDHLDLDTVQEWNRRLTSLTKVLETSPEVSIDKKSHYKTQMLTRIEELEICLADMKRALLKW